MWQNTARINIAKTLCGIVMDSDLSLLPKINHNLTQGTPTPSFGVAPLLLVETSIDKEDHLLNPYHQFLDNVATMVVEYASTNMESILGYQTTPVQGPTNRANSQNVTPVTLLTGKIGSSNFLPHITFQVDFDNKYNTYTTGEYDNYSKTFSRNVKDL